MIGTKSMFGQTSIASKRPILFYAALDFSSVPAFADSYRQQHLPGSKQNLLTSTWLRPSRQIRLIMPAQTCSNTNDAIGYHGQRIFICGVY